MNKRWLKNNALLLFLLILFGIGTGYAYLNSSLYINGTSIISANVWDVGLDNLNVTAGSVVAIKEPTLDNATTTSFEVKLDNKEDFYEFTVDVVNRGEYDAKLGSLVETTGFTTEQEQYFEHTVTYQNNEPIQVNQLVKKDEFVRLKSKVEYKDTVIATSVPESAKTLNLGFKLNYDLDDGTGNIVVDNGVYNPYKLGAEFCYRNECFYVMNSDATTVTMLAKYNLYVGNTCTSTTNTTCTEYGSEATGRQNYNMLGYTTNSGTVPFATSYYWYSGGLKPEYGTGYPAYVYDSNSSSYQYLQNYKSYLESIGVITDDVRLIKFNELTELGCSKEENSCSNAPSWVYSTSYWTGDATFGIRPVIVANINTLIEPSETIEFTIDGTTYYARDGMTWEEWISSEYNKDNYVISGNYIMKSSGTTYSLQHYANGTFGEISPARVIKNSIIVSDEYFFSNIPPVYN